MNNHFFKMGYQHDIGKLVIFLIYNFVIFFEY